MPVTLSAKERIERTQGAAREDAEERAREDVPSAREGHRQPGDPDRAPHRADQGAHGTPQDRGARQRLAPRIAPDGRRTSPTARISAPSEPTALPRSHWTSR